MLRRLAVAGLGLASLLTSGFAPDEMLDVPIEGFPDYMLASAPGSYMPVPAEGRGLYAWTEIEQRWEPGRALKVCFWGGTASARAKIARVADEWNGVGANIRLDFGPMTNPRTCNPSELIEIRVNFVAPRFYSLVGRQSITDVSMNQPSMNLHNFHYPAAVSDAEFRRLILHEFGHALGLMHEHQRLADGCDAEFDWDRIQTYMTGRPYYWSDDEVRKNLRPVAPRGQTFETPFDRSSIMLYAYPAQFYRRGRDSHCFVSPSPSDISESDKAAVRALYAVSETDRLSNLADAYGRTDISSDRDAIAVFTLRTDEILELRARERDSGEAALFDAAAAVSLGQELNRFTQRLEADDAPASLQVSLLNRYSLLRSTPEFRIDPGGAVVRRPASIPDDILAAGVERAFAARAQR